MEDGKFDKIEVYREKGDLVQAPEDKLSVLSWSIWPWFLDIFGLKEQSMCFPFHGQFMSELLNTFISVYHK